MKNSLKSIDYTEYISGLSEYIVNISTHNDGCCDIELIIPENKFILIDVDVDFIEKYFSTWSVSVPSNNNLLGTRILPRIKEYHVSLTTKFPL